MQTLRTSGRTLPASQALLKAEILGGSPYQQQAQQDSSSSSPKYGKPGCNGHTTALGKSSNSYVRPRKLCASMLAAIACLVLLVCIGFLLGKKVHSSQSVHADPVHHHPLWAVELQHLRETVIKSASRVQILHSSQRNDEGAWRESSASINATHTGHAGSHSSSQAVASVQGTEPQQDYQTRLRNAASKPINVVLMSAIFWALNPSNTQNCSVDGVPLDCSFTRETTQDNLETADVLYYHAPSFSGTPRPKAFPGQLRLVMTLESAAYYSSLDDPQYMCQFDAEMSYRRCAQVTNWYSLESFDRIFKTQLVPFEDKQHAVAYVNSNCGAKSGRSEIVRAMIKLGNAAAVPVHSFGRCDNNKAWPGDKSKIQVFQQYKFCVAMENSIAHDYVTEKIWDGLSAGCVPVYLGSRSIGEYVPDRRGIIVYDPKGRGDASTPQGLDALLHEIGNNKTRYEEMLAWKHRKVEDQPSPLFKYLWSIRHLTGECLLCQFVARHRVNTQPHYTTCLFNSTWMEEAGQKMVPNACAAEEMHDNTAP